MGLTLITPATAWPVTLDQAKAHCRVESGDEDDLLTGLIAAAAGHIEDYSGRAIGSQTWELSLDQFSPAILLSKGPVSAIISVKYVDLAGVLQTASPLLYSADLISDPQWVVLNGDSSWPVTLDTVNAVTIRFTTGYAEVPAAIRQACLLLIGHWYANREAVNVGNVATQLPLAVEYLLANHRSFAA